jgi:hypothetical protein
MLYNLGSDPWTDSDWSVIGAVVDEVAREMDTPLTLERLHAPAPEPLDEEGE